MTTQVTLAAVSNQTFSVKTSDGIRWRFRVYETNGCMSADVTKDDVPILAGQRLVSGSPIVPYVHMMATGGSWVMVTDRGAMPWWEQFGISQFLTYTTAAEIKAM